jgi:tetratricopeptide (TPR) repeat protein
LAALASLALPPPALAQTETPQALEKKSYQLLLEGKRAEAEKLQLEAIRIVEGRKGAQSPDLIPMLLALGRINNLTPGREKERIELVVRALGIAENAWGRDDPKLLDVLRTLASTHVMQGQFAEAEAVRKRAIAIVEKAHGPESIRVGYELMGLAYGYLAAKRYPEAEATFRRALALYEKEQHEHAGHASLYSGLARTYMEQGQYAEADVQLQRAIKVWESGPDAQKGWMSRRQIADNLEELYRYKAGIESKLGRHEDAVKSNERRLKLADGLLPAGIVYVAVWQLGDSYFAVKRYAEAEAQYKRALPFAENLAGRESLDAAMIHQKLGRAWAAGKRWKDAEGAFRRTLAIREKHWGSRDPDLRPVLEELARACRETGLTEDAQKLTARARSLPQRKP